MNVQDVPQAAHDAAAQNIVSAATAALTARRPEIPSAFVSQLFGLALSDDLQRYRPDDLAVIAERSWAFFADRRAGAPKLRFEPAPIAGAVSVLEIINDDMPFLLDSVLGELNQRSLDTRLLVHPVFSVRRDPAGALVAFGGTANEGIRESFIHIHIEGVPDEPRRTEIIGVLRDILAEVRVSVGDWQPMLARLREAIAELRHNPPPLPAPEIGEAVQFLEWLAADNFTLLGARDYQFTAGGSALDPLPETGLGLLRSPDFRLLRGEQLVAYTPEILEFLRQPKLLIVTKAALRSRVHRRVLMDYVGIKRFGSDGDVVGERRFCGLFTSTAYTRSVRAIPYLRRKTDAVIRRAGFEPSSHSGKALVNVLETYPRDDLFQIEDEQLYQFALAILQLDGRPRVRVLPRRERFDRFVSVLVYVPRERYDSKIRARIGDYLSTAYNATLSAFYPFFPEGPLVRVHFVLLRNKGDAPNPDRATLDQRVEAIVRSWTDSLIETLDATYETGKARLLSDRYDDAFPIDYREVYPPSAAVADIRVIEGLTSERPLGVEFYRKPNDAASTAGLRVLSWSRPIPLSERVPVLENMGFRVVDERTYCIRPAAAAEVWLHDMALEAASGRSFDIAAAKDRLESCFLVVMAKKAESDGYNALVLMTALGWRDVALARAISRFLRQIRVPYSQDYMWTTLRKHAPIAAQIVDLFYIRFDPHLALAPAERAAREAAIADIEAGLVRVDSLDEDRIVRHFVNAVQAAIRTNFFQLDRDGQPKELIALKFSSRKLIDMPLPRPLYEIFVYSPRLEGVHLRFGKVARGGIRWSDRPEDFRTEILGLVKAQNVKNAVIVPVGAKGGFVPKRLPIDGLREAIQEEGVATYRQFIATLLDITDNIGTGTVGVVPPIDVVRKEGDDPYFVVAADKGTATFSDIANEIAVDHDFWLGDAFASGGSTGYDHKKMGITARGAWESVKRHFREMNGDIAKAPFTMVGVGDMSGDVFGNGLLRERTAKLIAAFDHRDIFIDPNPDPERSFSERKRLFELPRSSWQDFDKTVLSKGGGVYSRSAKEINLSPEAQKLFGLGEPATSQEVIRAILTADVDLIFFGGIGTYVRAAAETDDAVGDRANDAVRVAATDLRCKVIGEGANLGMTQRARIEAALRGIRLNTDAIDNSAGVNTSDMEVNIKIALSIPLRDGRITTAERNALLAEMTEAVAGLVLRNNYLQPLALSLAERRGMEDFGFQARLIQTLESRGLLDRGVESLPDDAQLAERQRRARPLTRPELAVLLAYAKLTLYEDLLDSPVPDDPYLSRELHRYFPKAISERFPDALVHHRLRREIIATQLANSMINRGGPTLIVRIADQTGAAPSAIAAAFAAVRDSYEMSALNAAIDDLDNRVPGSLQLELHSAVQDLLLDRMVWFLRNVRLSEGLANVIAHFREGIAGVTAALGSTLGADRLEVRAANRSRLTVAGIPEELARRLADLPFAAAAPDIVLIADHARRPVGDVAATYFAASAFFGLDRIARAAGMVPAADYFDRLALERIRDAIGQAERRLTAAILRDASGVGAVEVWVASHRAEAERTRSALDDIATTDPTLSKLTVAASLLADLVKNAAKSAG